MQTFLKPLSPMSQHSMKPVSMDYVDLSPGPSTTTTATTMTTTTNTTATATPTFTASMKSTTAATTTGTTIGIRSTTPLMAVGVAAPLPKAVVAQAGSGLGSGSGSGRTSRSGSRPSLSSVMSFSMGTGAGGAGAPSPSVTGVASATMGKPSVLGTLGTTTTTLGMTGMTMGGGTRQLGLVDPVKASVAHLLTRGYALPCSTAAQAFTHLVQPTSRFQLALDALLPLLDAGAVEDRKMGGDVGEGDQFVELPQRILVAYILFSMYAPYPITVNPFKSVLLVAFVRERNKAVYVTNEGGVSTNEQLVWVLWKILRGDGNDIGPYTPSTLARSPLPAKLRASNLILDDAVYNTMFDIDDNVYSYFQQHQRLRSASSDPNYDKNESLHTTLRTVQSARTVEDERQNEKVAYGMKLLLAARERVLTLSEQRTLIPIIPDLAASQMVASLDMSPLAALNPQITHLLIVSIFNNTTKTANVELLYPYLDTLSCLPPTRPSFDLMGRLIQDTSPISLTGYSTVADLIRMEVLARFIHECIFWLERAEIEEREGLISDDRYPQGVQNLCRFFNSLVKLSIIDPTSDIDSAEMAHFSLRHARFEEANTLYRTLASARL